MQKRSEWNYNGYTWVHQDGRCLTRVSGYKPQAASDKPQAASNKRLDKVKQIQDNRGYKQKEKYGKHYKTNTTNE